MQNRLRLVTSVGCGWFMVCWNATCVYDVNRKSLNVDLLWTVCWLRPRDRRPARTTTATCNSGLQYRSWSHSKDQNKTSNHMTSADLVPIGPGTIVFWPEAQEHQRVATSLAAHHFSNACVNVSVQGPRKDPSLYTTRPFQIHQCWGEKTQNVMQCP